jgi:hypothetical protein
VCDYHWKMYLDGHNFVYQKRCGRETRNTIRNFLPKAGTDLYQENNEFIIHIYYHKHDSRYPDLDHE